MCLLERLLALLCVETSLSNCGHVRLVDDKKKSNSILSGSCQLFVACSMKTCTGIFSHENMTCGGQGAQEPKARSNLHVQCTVARKFHL